MDVHLEVGADLAFTLRDVPGELADAVRSYCAHYLRDQPAAGAVLIRGGLAPPGRTGSGEPVLDEPPLVIRRAAGCLLFELPGLRAWCDAAVGQAGLVVEGADPFVLTVFATRAVPLLLFELGLSRGWVGLHAAAVSPRGGAVLLPGVGGSGKTTIFRAAAAAGLGVLSDDLVWLREGDAGFRVVAFPRGWPAEPVPAPTVDDAPLAAIVCPTIVGEGPSRLVPIPPTEVVRELVTQTSFLDRGPQAGERFRRLVRAATAVPGFRLEAGPAGDAVAVLAALRV